MRWEAGVLVPGHGEAGTPCCCPASLGLACASNRESRRDLISLQLNLTQRVQALYPNPNNL